MSIQKPSVPKGTRDFSPLEMMRRNYIFDTIRKVFQLFGYQPIETPAMENLSTLLGKYGEEGDKLLFRILNSGDFLDPLQNSDLSARNFKDIMPVIAEKGLRYDLTVPFARFVVQHQNEILFPFKRYQIQPVWRADRPQKGRYREFFQCDVDVVGSDSLLYEVELIQIIDKVFTSLGVKYIIRLNNRKILSGIAEIIGEPGRLTDLTVSLDKMEKAGMGTVIGELREKGFSEASVKELEPFLNAAREKDFNIILTFLKANLQSSSAGMSGIKELETIMAYLGNLNLINMLNRISPWPGT